MRWIYMMTKIEEDDAMGGVGIFLSGMAAGAFLGALTVIVIALVMAKRKINEEKEKSAFCMGSP